MIRDQIETMLDVRGKELPAARDVVDSTQLEHALQHLEAMNLPAISSSQRNNVLFSDYTEKLQSMFPSCKLFFPK